MLVGTLLALVIVGVLVERSSLVALAEVQVAGTERLDAREVRRAADLELGTSTLRLPLETAEQRVERLPLVASAQVRRLDPLTVVIEVEEREPAAVVRRGQDAVLVDDDGVVVATGAEPGLPVIRLTTGQLPEPGQHIGSTPAAANAHAALSQLPGPVRSLVARYVAKGPDELELELVSGAMVRFGRADRVAEKARALGAVIEDLEGRTVATIDVRAPSRPVVLPGEP